MKHLILIASFILAVLASCTRPAAPMPAPEAPRHDELAAFDTLMQSQPDSALYALLDFNSTHKNLTPFDRHYADLLISEALFKCDYEQTLRNEVQNTLLYFDSLAAAQPKNDDYTLLSARAHYMNGVGFMESDSVVDACTEYLKALEIMEERFDEKELVGYKAKFMALTYNRLAQMFSDNYMMEQAITCYKRSVFYGEIQPTSKYGISKNLLQIGVLYNMCNQNDSTILYFNQVLEHLPDTDNIVFRDVSTALSHLSYQMHIATKEEVLECISILAKGAGSDEERISRYLVMGEICLLEKSLDSAEFFLEYAFINDNDLPSRLQAADYLKTIYLCKDDKQKADFYADFLSSYTVASYEHKRIESHLTELFQNHQQFMSENRHNKEKDKLLHKGFAVVGIFLLLATPILLCVRLRSRKRIGVLKNTIDQKEQQHIAYVSRMRNSNKRLREEIQGLIEKTNEPPVIPVTQNPTMSDYEALLREPVCVSIMNRIDEDIITTNPPSSYSYFAISHAKEQELADIMEKHSHGFYNKLTTLYPELKSIDINICRYILIKQKEPKIAVLLQKDYSTIWRHTKKIKDVMGCADIEIHLKNLIFEVSM